MLINEQTQDEIRAERARGTKYDDIAGMFGVSPTTARRCVVPRGKKLPEGRSLWPKWAAEEIVDLKMQGYSATLISMQIQRKKEFVELGVALTRNAVTGVIHRHAPPNIRQRKNRRPKFQKERNYGDITAAEAAAGVKKSNPFSHACKWQTQGREVPEVTLPKLKCIELPLQEALDARIASYS